MAFVCTASRHGPCPEPIVDDSAGCVVVLPIGYDDDAGIDYTLMVGLENTPGGGILEFFFCIIEVDISTGYEDRVWSGEYVSHKFTRYDRCVIKGCLILAARTVVQYTFPKIFNMITHDENLPDCLCTRVRWL
jgi:hypothetical protein